MLVSNDKNIIKTYLRPDIYEYFPFFSASDLERRLQFLPFHKATHLGLRNVETALTLQGGREMAYDFLEADAQNQRQLLAEALGHVGISSRTCNAIASTPRERFVRPEYARYSGLNFWVPFDSLSGQTMPGLIGLMIDQLDAHPGHRILEIGVGSGYHAACISEYLNHDCDITGLEFNEAYADFGEEAISSVPYKSIRILRGNAQVPFMRNERFDRIYMTIASKNGIPNHVVSMLNDNGIIQGVRAITEQEYGSEQSGSWLLQNFSSYENYLAGNWRSYCCLFTGVKSSCGIREFHRTYDVSFVPFNSDQSSYKSEHKNPFVVLLDLCS